MISFCHRTLLWAMLGTVIGVAPLRAWDWGDTIAPYNAVVGHSVKFSNLTKMDLGLRCTVFIKKASLPIPAYKARDYPGGITTEGSWIVVNGEFNELGKHFLVLAWFTGKRAGTFFPIAEDDIDHVALSDK
jgi:hypothetical protein